MYLHISILHLDNIIVYNTRLHTSMTILRKYNSTYSTRTEKKTFYI